MVSPSCTCEKYGALSTGRSDVIPAPDSRMNPVRFSGATARDWRFWVWMLPVLCCFVQVLPRRFPWKTSGSAWGRAEISQTFFLV